jgi:hypothetical protein
MSEKEKKKKTGGNISFIGTDATWDKKKME